MSTIFPPIRGVVLAACLVLSGAIAAPAAAPDSATLLWRGGSYAVGIAGTNEFRVADVARALGFEVSTEKATGVVTLSSAGHQIFLGAGTTQVPVDQRIVQISRAARTVGDDLYAPEDFFEKALFPLVGARGTYDSSRRVWALLEVTPVLGLEVAVVHLEPTTQIVLKESAPARFVATLAETNFQVRWPDQKIVAAFSERHYEDPLVSTVRLSSDAATIEFREKGLTARAYPLTNPDRLVVEVGRPPAGLAAAAPAPAPPPAVTIVIDPGHGGAETGAIGPGGLQEKEVTLQIARQLAAALSRTLPCRVIYTRDSDSAISLDDRTAVANHEKANLFLSIHANSSRTPGAKGSETYYLSLEASDKLAQEVANRENQVGPTPMPGAGSSGNPDLAFILWDLAQSAHLKESSELAEAIQEELNALSGTQNRGIKQAPFRVLVGATMPAVLVETAFISNPEEEKTLALPTFQQNVADAVARAVGRFFARRKGDAQTTPAAPTPARTP
ncbi:MAG: N-acetylmuramoyl-L-alanine amidase [Thermoanaerobaculia bacterium]